MKKTAILFYPNISKLSTRTNKIPIYLRIRKGTNKVKAKLDVYLKPEEITYWNEFTQRLDLKDNSINGETTTLNPPLATRI